MERAPLTTLRGKAVPLMLPNVDTDVIIRVERMTSTEPEALATVCLRVTATPGRPRRGARR